jgi:hypothetical protein
MSGQRQNLPNYGSPKPVANLSNDTFLDDYTVSLALATGNQL